MVGPALVTLVLLSAVDQGRHIDQPERAQRDRDFKGRAGHSRAPNASEAENKLMAPPTTRASWVWTHTRDRWTMDTSMPGPAQSTPVRARLKGGACFPAHAKEGTHGWAEAEA